MSLLLDARKKSQEALSALGGNSSPSRYELSMEEHPNAAVAPTVAPSAIPPPEAPLPGDQARSAGQNLFNAKAPAASTGLAGINRNLLFALGGTVLLFTAGAGYVWYIDAAGNNQPLRPIARPPATTPMVQPAPAIAAAPVAQPAPAITEAPLKTTLAPEFIPPQHASVKKTKRAKRPAVAQESRPTSSQTASTSSQPAVNQPANRPPASNAAPMYVEQNQPESIDPLLNSAYQAYREGKFDQAQQLYRDALKLDERNTDALLGLAVIAQRRGADSTAAHYYAKVLQLDPRDATANAGMSAFVTGDNRESRLKILLNEQPDSSSLHFALGNHYAAQERWSDAQQAYFNAYRLEPKSAKLAFNLAISLERLGQKKLSALYYQSALQLDSSQSEGFDHAKISQRIEELTR